MFFLTLMQFYIVRVPNEFLNQSWLRVLRNNEVNNVENLINTLCKNT